MNRAISARSHYAAGYYSSIWGQDRTRAIFSGMSPIEQRLHHKRAEWAAAQAEWKAAWDTPQEGHWLRMMDTLNAEIDALEEQERQAVVDLLEAVAA